MNDGHRGRIEENLDDEDSAEGEERAERDSHEEPAADEGGTAATIGDWLAGKRLPASAHLFLGLVVPAAIGLVNMWRLRAHTVDDAYISYRFARNLARGLGLVYNEGERIEGYTNFLWTVLLAAGIKIGIDPDTLAKALGAGFALGAMAILYGIDLRLRPHRVVPCLSTWLLASTGTFMGYAVFGLETAMFAFLVLAGTLMMIDEERAGAKIPWSGLVFGAAGITRPEAPMYLGLCMLFLGGRAIAPLERLRGRLQLGDPERDRLPLLLTGLVTVAGGTAVYLLLDDPSIFTRAGLVAAGVLGVILVLVSIPRSLFSRTNLLRGALFIVPIAAHVLWRKSYYDSWFPNTLSAKTGNIALQLAGGLDYLSRYIDHEGPVVYLALFGVAAAIVWRNGWLLAASAIATYGALYVVLVGGDWMPIFRFLAPVQPFLFLLVGVALRTLIEKRNRIANYGFLFLTVAIVGHRSQTLREDRRIVYHQEKRFWDTAAGGVVRWFEHQIAQRGREAVAGTIALGDIGQVGYETDFPILDLLGLVDPVIADLPGGYTHKVGPGFRNRFFEVSPRYFILISAENDCDHPSVIGSRVIYGDPRFRRSYAVSGRVPLDQGFFWCIYEHKSTWDPDVAGEAEPQPKRFPLKLR